MQQQRSGIWPTALLLAAALLAPPAAGVQPYSGLYRGAIVYMPGALELEMLVELAPGPDGAPTGTIDLLAFDDVTYRPLEELRLDGRRISFVMRRPSEVTDSLASYRFEGELSADGGRITGHLSDQEPVPFELERIGDAGSARPSPGERPVRDLSDSGAELRAAFDAHPRHARLVLLLSPT